MNAPILVDEAKYYPVFTRMYRNYFPAAEAFAFLQDDVGTVKVELDMLFTADQWREIQEL